MPVRDVKGFDPEDAQLSEEDKNEIWKRIRLAFIGCFQPVILLILLFVIFPMLATKCR